MRVLITGGNGYLGTKVVEEVTKRGHTAVLLILQGTSTEMFSNKQNIEIYSTNESDIEKALKTKIDCVLHLATLYGRNKEDTKNIIQANLIFPLHVLENAIKNNVKYFFNMDTAIHKLINQYTITKKQFRYWGELYGTQERIRFINMKSEHFYGPFDKDIKFIANMLKQFKNNREYVETTFGEQERAFIYIDDLLEAIFSIINYEFKKKKLEFIEYEVGPDDNIKIKDALNIMKRLTNSSTEIKFGAIPYRKNEEMQSKCDNSKLKETGWKQKTLSFEEGIKKILLEEEKNENIN